jgi:hypothetical protein
LALRHLDSRGYHAELTSNDLSASARIGALDGCDGLDEFFADLANSWKGWAGAKRWRGREGGFYLSASSDRTGHVTLEVRLEDQSPFRWAAVVNFILEAGQLASVAKQASAFATLFSTAA